MSLYYVAGVDLQRYVAEWVAKLESGQGDSRGLLSHAKTDPELRERYSDGAHYMMANVGPQAVDAKATPETLLLFAVLSVYQDAEYPNADPTLWEGEKVHVDRAFEYFHVIGEKEAAERLRKQVIRRSLRDDKADLERFLGRPLHENPGKAAAHAQEIARIESRSVRAANLLDPEGDFDSSMIDLISED